MATAVCHEQLSVETIQDAWIEIYNKSGGNLFFVSEPDWDLMTKYANDGCSMDLEWDDIFEALCLVSGGKRWGKDGDGDVEYLLQRDIKKKKISRELAFISHLMGLAGEGDG
jgi:hypothetical protein